MDKINIVNVIITVNNLSKDIQYKISAHPREFEALKLNDKDEKHLVITAGLTLEQELRNSQLVEAFVTSKSFEDREDLETVMFEVILSNESQKDLSSKDLEKLASEAIKNLS